MVCILDGLEVLSETLKSLQFCSCYKMLKHINGLESLLLGRLLEMNTFCQTPRCYALVMQL